MNGRAKGRPKAASRLMKSLGLGQRGPARVPDNMRVYAVGDIHGCSRVLDLLHQRIEADCKNYSGDRHIVYLGDFTDRGPDSKGVLERLLHDVPGGLSPHYIRGNHDQAVLDFLEDPESYRVWRGFGGAETLLSYGVRPPLYDQTEQITAARDDFAKALPVEHLEFLRGLELKISIGDYAFVHAGIRPGVSLDRQSEQDLLWIREEFLFSNARHEKVVVHGHTPLPTPVRTSNRISIDTGAYATGVLTACVLEDTACRFLQAKAG